MRCCNHCNMTKESTMVCSKVKQTCISIHQPFTDLELVKVWSPLVKKVIEVRLREILKNPRSEGQKKPQVNPAWIKGTEAHLCSLGLVIAGENLQSKQPKPCQPEIATLAWCNVVADLSTDWETSVLTGRPQY
ncbi:uncharacterized [Tachysurus ichikawai]